MFVIASYPSLCRCRYSLEGYTLCASPSMLPLSDAPSHHNLISPHSARSNHAAGFAAALGLAKRYPRSAYTITDKLSLFMIRDEKEIPGFFEK